MTTWKLKPSTEESHADFAAQTIYIVVSLPSGAHYDSGTLTLVLLHELVHAALGPTAAHNAAFFFKEKQGRAALSADRILPLGAAPNPWYPAQILDAKDFVFS